MKWPTAFAVILACAMAAFASPRAARPVEQVQRVLIVSIDGLRPDLLLRADAPNLHALVAGGSYSFWARTTASSITLPSHVSMLTGVTPEVHAITWNADLPLAQPVYPAAPTLFESAKKAGYSTAMAAGKMKFNVMDKPGSLDWSYFPTSPVVENHVVIAGAERIIREHRPDVMFVHLPGVDVAGHAKGWGSPEQMRAIEEADACVGVLLAALEELKLRDSTVIVISADHGGAGRTHGPDDPRSRTIPWVVNGPGIRKNFDLTRVPDLDVETFDTFATASAMLGIPVERRVRGKFISQILEDRELLQSPARTNGNEDPATRPATATQPAAAGAGS